MQSLPAAMILGLLALQSSSTGHKSPVHGYEDGVVSVTPNRGSVAGGTLITIRAPALHLPSWHPENYTSTLNGGGTVEVVIGGSPCDVVPGYFVLGDGRVVCQTRPMSAELQADTAMHAVVVTVWRPGNAPVAIVGAFRYRSSAWQLMPVVERVEPAIALPGPY